jgi:hypothetical protein
MRATGEGHLVLCGVLPQPCCAAACRRIRITSRTINQAGCEDGGRVSSRALKAIKPDYLIPLHCSGDRFREIAKAEMPQNFIRTSVGTRLVFGT